MDFFISDAIYMSDPGLIEWCVLYIYIYIYRERERERFW